MSASTMHDAAAGFLLDGYPAHAAAGRVPRRDPGPGWRRSGDQPRGARGRRRRAHHPPPGVRIVRHHLRARRRVRRQRRVRQVRRLGGPAGRRHRGIGAQAPRHLREPDRAPDDAGSPTTANWWSSTASVDPDDIAAALVAAIVAGRPLTRADVERPFESPFVRGAAASLHYPAGSPAAPRFVVCSRRRADS